VPDHIKEAAFETDIEEWLLSDGGYVSGKPANLDLQLGMDPIELLAFIHDTQPTNWAKLVQRSSSEAKAAEALLKRLASALNERGAIAVLRGDFDVTGVRFRLAYLPPSHGRNATLTDLARRNRLVVYRQARFEPGSNATLDLLLGINGVPVATAELKNPLNGQTMADAIEQYRSNRDVPRNVILNRRCLVHFAADTNLVAMTTQLAGADTRFLPFNRGSNPGELSCGSGNPPVPGGYATSYLWEQVWSYDAWLDILQNFFVVTAETDPETGATTSATLFPRFQQWDAVRAAIAAVSADGPGSSYLFQHSAGSGKSNTIAWTGDRLSRLDGPDDKRLFDKVIVITDRRVLDEQLRRNVEQFERTAGAVQTVIEGRGSKSTQLLEALRSNAKIITVTLESFPYVIGKLVGDEEFKARNYAVIADEAHSSQTGEANRALKEILGAGVDVDSSDPDFDSSSAIAAVLASRGRQPNISFFAFTATPKDRTVEMFGTEQADGSPKRPFHLYTMRQAIEEGFILDVLENYATYETYWRIASADPEFDSNEVPVSRVNSAIRRVVHQNPSMISEKAAIVVEHVRSETMKHLGGRAQAMVVTESRAAAVRYKQAIDFHIGANGYSHIKSLVAFSGSIPDDKGVEQTEAGMNGFSDKQTADRFLGKYPHSQGEYQILIVAEKYQTGFDDPLLDTMFVDKTLSGLNAVQTLSRLNRSYSAAGVKKEHVYVVDFRNTADQIQEAFQPYYEGKITNVTSFDKLWDLRRQLEDTGLLDPDEVRKASDVWFGASPEDRQLKKIQTLLDEFVVRFSDAPEEVQIAFVDTGDAFVRAYSFLSHIMSFTDEELERLYVFVKAALKVIPREATGAIDVSDKVTLTHLRLTPLDETDIELEAGKIDAGDAYKDGTPRGPGEEPPMDVFAQVIQAMNDQYGADLDERDKLEAEKLDLGVRADPTVVEFAKANNFDDFLLEYERVFKGVMLDQEERNGRLYQLLFTNTDMLKVWQSMLARELWNEANELDTGTDWHSTSRSET